MLTNVGVSNIICYEISIFCKVFFKQYKKWHIAYFISEIVKQYIEISVQDNFLIL